jgi:glycolate oxidase
MQRLFSADDLEVMTRVRIALNPDGRCSPSKMLPTAGACGMEHIERSHPGKQAHA